MTAFGHDDVYTARGVVRVKTADHPDFEKELREWLSQET